ncbi:uncharacterized protein DC041_0002094 [Schistosoma bovis]|uniref:Uncharacterized protein n=1 Tax=Schistosoma bovis TaxID=6184 RepID=A0A430QSE8_SCHBO|nr:uncharacterized protein DC041_0002094 [Schistosoma bovis]
MKLSMYVLGLLQAKLTTIESQLALLNSLPNNEDIIGYIDNDIHNKKNNNNNNNSLDNSNDNYRKVTNLWQTVQTNKRLDATEEGLHRLSLILFRTSLEPNSSQ